MKIYILNDEDETTYLGGAALVNKCLKDELIKQGHEVTCFRINNRENTWNNDMSADLYIVGNWGYMKFEDIENLFNNKPIVKFYHDIAVGLYQLPTIKLEKLYEILQFIHNKAILNIYISPLQMEWYSRFIKLDEKKAIIIPPPKDNLDLFYNKGLERENKVLYLGDISDARGIDETLNILKHNNLEGIFYGPWVDQRTVNKILEAGHIINKEISNDKVPDLMNKYKYFIYLPNLIDSFCFKVLEAELCGMEAVTDRYRIGRYSYNLDTDNMKKIVNESCSLIISNINTYYNSYISSDIYKQP